MSGSGKGFPFVKVVVILACAFGVGLGLCGLDAALLVASSGHTSVNQSMGPLMGVVGVASMVLLALSGLGMVVTFIAWVVVQLSGSGKERSDPQRPYGGRDDEGPNGPS